MNAKTKERGRGSFPIPLLRLVLAANIALASLIVCVAGCQDSRLPAASRPVSEPADRSGSAIPSGASDQAVPRTGAPQTGQAAPTPVRPQAIRDISFDAVKLNLKKGDPFKRTLITPAIEKLDGSRIRIRGYILPPFQQTGLAHFVLVRDNMACCFGPGAAIYDSMIVDLRPGVTTDYTVSPIAVEGTFNIREVEGPGGNAISIYHVTGEKVE
ncbi:MAG TPA: DUF3299 domain-containing protein [Pirellulales bacterium]|jgi:hypothetical protein|nr:DUF3299 domain-containing protein [Pirellulales bacterium]